MEQQPTLHLRVLERPHDSSSATISEDYLFVEFEQADFSKPPRCRTFARDDDSIGTRSTASLSDTDSFDRRVSFASELVTREWTRPFTEPNDVATLYYTTDETQR
jgi:hypothetical protein